MDLQDNAHINRKPEALGGGFQLNLTQPICSMYGRFSMIFLFTFNHEFQAIHVLRIDIPKTHGAFLLQPFHPQKHNHPTTVTLGSSKSYLHDLHDANPEVRHCMAGTTRGGVVDEWLVKWWLVGGAVFLFQGSLITRWCFHIFFIFTPNCGEDEPILRSIFFKGVGSTTN